MAKVLDSTLKYQQITHNACNFMNHEELKILINNLEGISININNKLKQLKELQAIREATRNTGTRLAPRYTTYGTNYGRDNTNRTPNQDRESNTNRKLKVGNIVKVIRGRNQGVIATIIRETTAQYELRSDHVNETFRKWKNNVKKARDQE